MNSFETMAKLGGYILMFSILSAAISHFWYLPAQGKYILLGLIEVTTGLHGLCCPGFLIPFSVLLALCMSASEDSVLCSKQKAYLERNSPFIRTLLPNGMNAAVTAALILIFL